MNADLQKAISPLRRLRKILGDFSAHPSPEDVHDLRTRARRLEAIVHALSPERDPAARRLLKLVKPVRKAAGKVRDMDVMLANLFALSDEPAGEGLLRLAEHLAKVRSQHADRLYRVVDRRRNLLRKRLKRYTSALEQSASGNVSTLAAPQVLATELEHWPRLHQDNLHEFRKQAKELRYILQLTPDTVPERVEALTATKDAVGEWHDWVELRAVAEEVLDPKTDGEILKHIAAITREKLRAGLSAANRLRKVGLELPEAA
jgi:CHAD domain-containing protein